MSVAIFGFISRDIITKSYSSEKVEKIGGKGYYSGLCLASLGEPVSVFFPIGPNSEDLIQQTKTEKLTLFGFPAEETPVYENFYLDDSLNNRIFKAKVNSKFIFDISLFNAEMISNLRICSFIHLAPTSINQVPIELIKFLKKESKAVLSADLDYIIKNVDENGEAKLESWEIVKEIMSLLDIVMLSKEDFTNLTEDSEEAFLKSIADTGPTEVILTKGSQGAVIYSSEEECYYEIPTVEPEKIVDATGAGDSFASGFLTDFIRHNGNIEKAIQLGMANSQGCLSEIGAKKGLLKKGQEFHRVKVISRKL